MSSKINLSSCIDLKKLNLLVVRVLIRKHLVDIQTGLMDEGVKVTLLGLWMALLVVFAGRKFTQPIKVRSLPFWSIEISKFQPTKEISCFLLSQSLSIFVGWHRGQICLYVQCSLKRGEGSACWETRATKVQQKSILEWIFLQSS